MEKTVIMKEDFYFIDYDKINSQEILREKALRNVNELKQMILSEVGELSKKQMEAIPKDCMNVLRKEVKGRFQFPDATDEFNLKALGINLTGIESYYKEKNGSWNSYPVNAVFDYKDGEYILANEQPSISRHQYKLTTKQKEIVAELERIIDGLKKLQTLEVVPFISNINEIFKNDLINTKDEINLNKENIVKL